MHLFPCFWHAPMVAALAALIACAGSTNEPSSSNPPASDASAPIPRAATDAGAGECERVSGRVVDVPTDDGLTLEGDLYTTGSALGAGVVLLHMIPPSNDRTNYPPAFLEALAARGLSVLNLDRRGARGDAAVARTAYTGPAGKLDAKAAYDFLTRQACGVDPRRIAFVGASNGTTTALDFTVHAAEAAEIELPSALVFLTGGGYTETNTRITDHRGTLDPLPILFVFSTAERGWSAALEAGAPPSWVFREYDPGDHGTRMFGAQPGAVTLVADFLAERL